MYSDAAKTSITCSRSKAFRIIHAELAIVLTCFFFSVSQCRASSLPKEVPSFETTTIQTKSNNNIQKHDSVEQFLQDLDNLSQLNATILAPTESKHDSSFTKSWNLEDWERHQVRSFLRYGRHVTTWFTSPTALAVLPTVLTLVCWAFLIQYLAKKYDTLGHFISHPSLTKGVASFGSPISLLLALRTNRSLNRLFEARSMFGKIVRASLSLSNLAAVYVGPNSQDSALLMGRYLSIYGWCVKGFFRREPDQLLIKAILPEAESKWLLEQTRCHKMDTPTCIHSRLRYLIAAQMDKIPLAAANAMEDRLSVLESALGVSKRLLGSPIPPTYTRHTSRVLCLFLGLLPFALVGVSYGHSISETGFMASVVVTLATTAYVFVGIDEIGVEVENPFPLLPMHALASVIQRNVRHQLRLMNNQPTTS